MDGITAGIGGCANHARDVQPCGDGRRSENFNGFVGFGERGAELVVAVHGHHRGDTHAPGGADNAQGDFCTVGDE